MIGKIKIGNLTIRGVIRHRFEKGNSNENILDRYSLWREHRLGLWFKTYRVVGRKDFNNPTKWKNNMVNQYLFGIDLIIVKMWIDIDFGAMSLEI